MVSITNFSLKHNDVFTSLQKKETPFTAYRTPMSTMKSTMKNHQTMKSAMKTQEKRPLLSESNVLDKSLATRILTHSDLIAIVRGEDAKSSENSSEKSLTSVLKNTFLPVGYPHTVREGYMKYQIFDLIQGLCSYLRGQLAHCVPAQWHGVERRHAAHVH